MQKNIDYGEYREPGGRDPVNAAIKVVVVSMVISAAIVWFAVFDGYRRLPVSFIADYWKSRQATVVRPEVKPVVLKTKPDPVKTAEFHVIRAALLCQYLGPKEFDAQLDQLCSTDWSPEIGDKLVLDTMVDVDRRYSRFLVKDRETWEPMISKLRLAISHNEKGD